MMKKISLFNESINTLVHYENLLSKSLYCGFFKDMKVKSKSKYYNASLMPNLFNSHYSSLRRKNKINYHIASTKTYSTNQKHNINKEKQKFKLSKLMFTLLICSTGFYFIYNTYLSKTHNSLILQSQKGKYMNKLHSAYNLFKDYLTLPYNSYVLLDKLQPVSKGIEKTLVLNLDKTLVSYNYSIIRGFEVFARPGLFQFIQELGKVYEIVLFSNEDSTLIEEITNQIDPKNEFIRFKLGKEAMRIYKGKTIKDLNYLNRNLNNVIVVDFDPENVLLHQRNTIIIPEFNCNGKDRELLLLIVFLKDMAKKSVKNIREELDKYGHYKPYLKYYKAYSKYHKLLPKL